MSTSWPKKDNNFAFWPSNGDTQLLNSQPCLALTLSSTECLCLQIKITFIFEYLVYAINCTMFFTFETFWFEILESYAKHGYRVSQRNRYSLYEVVYGCKAMQSE